MTNYLMANEGHDSYIYKTGESPNGVDVFSTFERAKKALITELEDQMALLSECVETIKNATSCDSF